MARIGAGVGEDHRPRHVGDPPPQLRVDEVGDAAEAQPDRCRHRQRVRDLEERIAAAAREQEGRHQHADQAAVERHAAPPDREHVERMGEVVVRLVEQDVADPAAKDDAQRDVEDEVVDGFGRDAPAGALHQPPYQPPAEHDPGDVGQRVPADRERADRHENRVHGGEGDREDGQDSSTSHAMAARTSLVIGKVQRRSNTG